MASPTSGQTTNLGMAPNVAGMLCYFPFCVGLFFSLVVIVVEKQSLSVRFHGFHSLLLHAAAIIVGIGFVILRIILGMVAAPLALLVWLLSLLVGFAFLGLVVLLAVKTYGGEELELPAIGEMARNLV